MKLDSGRVKDLQMLETKLKNSVDSIQRSRIKTTMNMILAQAQDDKLSAAREQLLNARRVTTNAIGEINIKNAREEANRLEEQVHKTFR